MASTQPTDIGRKAARGSVWTGTANYVVFVASFATGIVLARLIEPAVFGVFAFAAAIVGLLRMIATIGYQDFLIRRKELEPETVGTVFSVSLVIGAGVILLWALACPILVYTGTAETLWVTGILAVVAAIAIAAEVPLALLQRTFALKSVAIIQVVSGLAGCAATLGAVLLGGELSALLVQGAGATLLMAVLYFARTPVPLKLHWDRGVVSELLRKGKSFFGSGVIMTLFRQLDKIVIGAALAQAQLGFYNRAQRMSGLFEVIVPTAVTRTVLPMFSAVKEDRGKLVFAYDLMVSMHLLLLAPLGIGLFFGAEAVIELLYGSNWLPAAPVFRVLTLALVMTPLVGIANLFHIALNHPERMMRARTAAFLAFVPALFAGLHFGGITGASWAVVVFEAVSLTILLRATAGVISAKAMLRPILPHVVAILVSVPVLSWFLGLERLADWSGVARLLALAGATLAIYGTVLVLIDRRKLVADIGYLWEKLGSPSRAALPS